MKPLKYIKMFWVALKLRILCKIFRRMDRRLK